MSLCTALELESFVKSPARPLRHFSPSSWCHTAAILRTRFASCSGWYIGQAGYWSHYQCQCHKGGSWCGFLSKSDWLWLACNFDRVSTSEVFFLIMRMCIEPVLGAFFPRKWQPWRWLDIVSFCLISRRFLNDAQLIPTFTETLQGLVGMGLVLDAKDQTLPFEILWYWSLMNLKKSHIFPPDLRSMLPRKHMAIPWMRSYHVVWRFGLQGRLVRSWCRRCTSSCPNSRNLQQPKLEGAHLGIWTH